MAVHGIWKLNVLPCWRNDYLSGLKNWPYKHLCTPSFKPLTSITLLSGHISDFPYTIWMDCLCAGAPELNPVCGLVRSNQSKPCRGPFTGHSFLIAVMRVPACDLIPQYPPNLAYQKFSLRPLQNQWSLWRSKTSKIVFRLVLWI